MRPKPREGGRKSSRWAGRRVPSFEVQQTLRCEVTCKNLRTRVGNTIVLHNWAEIIARTEEEGGSREQGKDESFIYPAGGNSCFPIVERIPFCEGSLNLLIPNLVTQAFDKCRWSLNRPSPYVFESVPQPAKCSAPLFPYQHQTVVKNKHMSGVVFGFIFHSTCALTLAFVRTSDHLHRPSKFTEIRCSFCDVTCTQSVAKYINGVGIRRLLNFNLGKINLFTLTTFDRRWVTLISGTWMQCAACIGPISDLPYALGKVLRYCHPPKNSLSQCMLPICLRSCSQTNFLRSFSGISEIHPTCGCTCTRAGRSWQTIHCNMRSPEYWYLPPWF